MRGALVRKSQHQVVMRDTTTLTTFDVVDYDTDGFFVENGSKFVIPCGVSKVRLIGAHIWARTTDGFRQGVIKKFGQFFPGGPCKNQMAVDMTTTDYQVVSPVLYVQQGDEFTLEAYQTAMDPLGITLFASPGTFFSIEVVE